MTTIMSIGNSEGTRRCDERCHGAREPACACICEGRYHGKGGQAQELLKDDLLEGRWGTLQKMVQATQEKLVFETALRSERRSLS